MNQTRVQYVEWSKASKRLLAVRCAVFVDEQNVPIEIEHDEWDEKSRHVILIHGGQDIGTGRLLPTGYIGRVAVLKEFRGLGMGLIIMKSLIEKAREVNMSELTLSSQVQALGFYKKIGFEEVSEVYEEAGIPHVKMKLKL